MISSHLSHFTSGNVELISAAPESVLHIPPTEYHLYNERGRPYKSPPVEGHGNRTRGQGKRIENFSPAPTKLALPTQMGGLRDRIGDFHLPPENMSKWHRFQGNSHYSQFLRLRGAMSTGPLLDNVCLLARQTSKAPCQALLCLCSVRAPQSNGVGAPGTSSSPWGTWWTGGAVRVPWRTQILWDILKPSSHLFSITIGAQLLQMRITLKPPLNMNHNTRIKAWACTVPVQFLHKLPHTIMWPHTHTIMYTQTPTITQNHILIHTQYHHIYTRNPQ